MAAESNSADARSKNNQRDPADMEARGRARDDDFVVAPDERLGWARTIGIGAQHVVAMFGATFLVPVLTGFPPATTLLFSGVGTVLFLLITGNRLPSYLGFELLGDRAGHCGRRLARHRQRAWRSGRGRRRR